jgi:hypothetical protein
MTTMTDVGFSFGENADGLFTQHHQDIDSGFLGRLRDKRNASSHGPIGDYMHVASVPVVFIHKWMKEGFNAYQAPLKDVVAKLRAEGLTDFLASDKQAF